MAEEEESLEAEIVYPITCGDSRANLIWRKFVCPGINVKCVQVRLQHECGCVPAASAGGPRGTAAWGSLGGCRGGSHVLGRTEEKGVSLQGWTGLLLTAEGRVSGGSESLVLECSCGERLGSRPVHAGQP